jgi:hypothetical protein
MERFGRLNMRTTSGARNEKASDKSWTWARTRYAWGKFRAHNR